MSKRKNHNPSFKARVALEAIKGEQTITELASRFGVQSNRLYCVNSHILGLIETRDNIYESRLFFLSDRKSTSALTRFVKCLVPG